MAKSKSGSGGARHRSAVTGRYVKESYANKHPRTTVRETVKKKGK